MDIHIDVPDGVSGDWRIETKEISEGRARLLAAMSKSRRYVPAGTYKLLIRGFVTVMSNTPDEIADHHDFYWNAKGRVLVNGLGLGMAIEMVIQRVDHMTIVENSPDVIALVAPHYLAKYPDKLEIVHADAFEYQPPKGVRYNAVWHDIWDNICADNPPEMARLHRKYGRRADWQGSWARDLCRFHRGR